MSFELKQQVTLSKVNIRKKGPADARILMIDLKLRAITQPEILAHFDPTLRHFLFLPDGAPRLRQLKPLAWDGSMGHMQLTIAGEWFRSADLGKFRFEALPNGQVALSFVAAVHPQSRQTAILADLAGDEVAVSIVSEQEELDLQDRTTEALHTEVHDLLAAAGAGHLMTNAPIDALRQTDTPDLIGTTSESTARLGADSEEAYQEAVKLVHETNRASISHIQRHLRIGYTGAARLLERMTNEGIVGLDGNGRHGLIHKSQRKAVIKYRHPDNDQLTWSGRGKPPAWAKKLMDAGRALEVA